MFSKKACVAEGEISRWTLTKECGTKVSRDAEIPEIVEM